MINSNKTQTKIIVIVSIILIMLSAIFLERALTQFLMYFKEPSPLIEGQPLSNMDEFKRYLARDIIIHFVSGALFLIAGVGCLYLKNWARKLILLIGIAGCSYQAFIILQEVYKYKHYELFSYRMFLILFFAALLVIMSIKKNRTLFARNQQV